MNFQFVCLSSLSSAQDSQQIKVHSVLNAPDETSAFDALLAFVNEYLSNQYHEEFMGVVESERVILEKEGKSNSIFIILDRESSTINVFTIIKKLIVGWLSNSNELTVAKLGYFTYVKVQIQSAIVDSFKLKLQEAAKRIEELETLVAKHNKDHDCSDERIYFITQNRIANAYNEMIVRKNERLRRKLEKANEYIAKLKETLDKSNLTLDTPQEMCNKEIKWNTVPDTIWNMLPNTVLDQIKNFDTTMLKTREERDVLLEQKNNKK